MRHAEKKQHRSLLLRPHFLPVLALLLTSASAAASEQLDINYYAITGSTSRQLLEAMQSQGPQADDGRRFHGYTRWQVRWKYQATAGGSNCRIRNVETQVAGTITLPEWTDASSADDDLLNRWQNYSRILREHEEGHYQFALDAAASIRQQLTELPPQPCSLLNERANRLGMSLVDEQRQREIAYDRDTNHGRLNGLKL